MAFKHALDKVKPFLWLAEKIHVNLLKKKLKNVRPFSPSSDVGGGVLLWITDVCSPAASQQNPDGVCVAQLGCIHEQRCAFAISLLQHLSEWQVIKAPSMSDGLLEFEETINMAYEFRACSTSVQVWMHFAWGLLFLISTKTTGIHTFLTTPPLFAVDTPTFLTIHVHITINHHTHWEQFPQNPEKSPIYIFS